MRVQWRGDNLAAVEQLVARVATVRYHDIGKRSLELVGREFVDESLQDAAIVVNLGDSIEVKIGADGFTDSIGIHRPPDPGDDGEITWTGGNPFEIAMFVRKHEITVSMDGSDLILKESAAAKKAQEPNAEARRSVLSGGQYIRMRRGDKLLLQHGCLFMSRAGQDYRV